KLPDINRLYIGPRLTLCFAVIISLMLAGDGFLLWQLNIARAQTNRMTGISEELIAVVRLQRTLLSFDDNLDRLAQSEDIGQLSRNAGPLREVLLQGTQETWDTLAHLPPGVHPDPSFLPTIGAIESALPSQLEAITALAASGDWTAVRLRLANEKKPLEYQASTLVKNINQEVSEEQARAVVNISRVQRRMLLTLPATATFTLLTAALLGLAITRSITEPLRRLVEGSRALARGDFEHQVSISGQDEIAQVGQVFNDTADRLRFLYETLQNSEAHLSEAQRLTHMGSWVWRVEGRTCLHLSEEWYRVWGFDPKEGLPGWEKRLQRVHPADRAMWEDTIERAIREKSDYDVEFRILLPDGAVKWLHTV